jgi:hypothetical protein
MWAPGRDVIDILYDPPKKIVKFCASEWAFQRTQPRRERSKAPYSDAGSRARGCPRLEKALFCAWNFFFCSRSVYISSSF